MKIHRSKHSENFTILPNAALRDERLSYRARGVLMELLSRPEDWQTTADALARTAKQQRGKKGEGRDAMRGAFAELKAAGYLVASKGKGESGTHTTELHVYDVAQDVTSEDAQNPRSDRGTENQSSVNQASADQSSENQASLRRTDHGSTDTKDCSTKDSSSSAEVEDITHEAAPTDSKKKTSKPQDREQAKTLIGERFPDSTAAEREAIIDLVYAEAAAKGVKIGFIATYIGGRPAALLEQDLAQVRRHSAAPTITHCGIHQAEMKPYGCEACAAEIKAGDRDQAVAHLALVGEKARPDLARLLGAPQTPTGATTGGWSWEHQHRAERRHRNGVVGGTRHGIENQATYDTMAQMSQDELRALMLG